MELIKQRIIESIDVKNAILNDEKLLEQIFDAGEAMKKCLEGTGKVLLCGNGGSATDSVHIAGELVGRFQKERKSMPAIALPADIASLTSIANDYSYNDLFAREVEGLLSKSFRKQKG